FSYIVSLNISTSYFSLHDALPICDYSVLILAPNERRAEKIHGILKDYEIDSVVAADNLTLPVHLPTIIVGDITSGIEMPMHKLADRKSTRLNSSHVSISYAVFCLK